jgi:hypothetical protein
MRLPTDKYNGRFIVEFSLQLRIRMHRWDWRPKYNSADGVRLSWGFF